MPLSGTNQSVVKVTLRNPLDYSDLLDYYIVPNSSPLGQDWVLALKKLLEQGNTRKEFLDRKSTRLNSSH